jgi:hypothetical protein
MNIYHVVYCRLYTSTQTDDVLGYNHSCQLSPFLSRSLTLESVLMSGCVNIYYLQIVGKYSAA